MHAHGEPRFSSRRVQQSAYACVCGQSGTEARIARSAEVGKVSLRKREKHRTTTVVPAILAHARGVRGPRIRSRCASDGGERSGDSKSLWIARALQL